ncbi:MAG: hypothetical protein A3C79_03160 [Candidatus Taylorbacteria bacterium RIFCSPHIGHO2_02_FULL_45_28]|uniref:Uncharacterized protein n=1 Tax=Candidatus Taylorbacteria bacterium RIFCSPHIGHO2_12_FULL_45_16 TaxID=1802315 RepID=A0A1G2N105_9BACT|nr:MAG: hypothetical protein A2830_00880 [Candidatus Taylorbacteria bacterium RIFCSPHIGHO2_01_FULL_44_110]OHA24956.1 MAG: hypothetical protein A3C79_03160 [Candidatus Taylorbacteria bacterium RIFCSPHIGHO2_02_FULL_45_28]OHA29774.1 MAG: hypothetical protein A3F51_03575 [Candidatus Taylorbacteria bacterium RIFCSPHIGHO2_12_FULL_45_16]OHA32718.1 MAG: hypothetical protein A3A23_00445 [Candidatus Taylorbacteria bacterium RIFCSPLOWO2_01_FULL_45_59]OHA39012.1 MAG: hypothetical protein A3I98_00020 [Candi
MNNEILQTISSIFALIGVPATIAGFIYVGRKLQVLDTLAEDMGKVKHNLKVVTDYLTRYHLRFDPGNLKALSPISLTDQGNDFIKELGFDEVFEQNKNDFFNFIDSENPKFKYDVELSAIKSVFSLADRDYMSFLKIYLYNNPSRTINDTAPTLGIYVRDKYLAEHSEIKE